MKTSLYIASRLNLDSEPGRHTVNQVIATVTMSLAVAVMLMSVFVTQGFKSAIIGKLYGVEPHVEVTNALTATMGDSALVNIDAAHDAITASDYLTEQVKSISGSLLKPVMLKTDNDFEALQLRTVDNNFDWAFINSSLVAGEIPAATDTMAVLVSQSVARKLHLNTGDRVMAYFVDERVKARRLDIAGIFDTQLDAFDNVTMLGNMALLQSMLQLPANVYHSLTVTLKDPQNNVDVAYALYTLLLGENERRGDNTQYSLMPLNVKQRAFFAWLDMLDMNVIVIITLMMIVSAFTIVASLLMIVLRRTATIGLFKALGATNGDVRLIFILLTHKLVLRAMVLGNALALVLALLQRYFHIISLDPSSYYMSSVPIEINLSAIILVNVGYLVVSALTLVVPSMVVSSVSPSTSMRFE